MFRKNVCEYLTHYPFPYPLPILGRGKALIWVISPHRGEITHSLQCKPQALKIFN